MCKTAKLLGCVHVCTDEADLMSCVYPFKDVAHALQQPENSDIFSQRDILCLKNDGAQAINDSFIRFLPTADDEIAVHHAKHDHVEETAAAARALVPDDLMNTH